MMLINNNSKIEVDDIASFKLNTGEEFVAKVLGVSEDHWVLDRPRAIAPGRDDSLRLVPMMFTAATKPCTLYKQHVVMVAVTSEEVKAGYIQVTTGITVAPAGSMLR